MMKRLFFILFFCLNQINYAQTISSLIEEGSLSGGGDGYSGYTEDARGVCVDASGNIYVTGAYVDTCDYSGTELVSVAGRESGYLAKYNNAGVLQWVKAMKGTSHIRPRSISITGTGGSASIYVTGILRGGTGTFGALTITTAGGDDVFIAQYDASGNEQWVQQAGGTSSDYQDHQGCVSDAIGNVYVTGVFNGTMSFGAPITHSLTSAGAGDAFLVKYNSSGIVQWVVGGYNATGFAQGYGIALNPSEDNVYVTGYYASTTLSWGSYTVPGAAGSRTYLVDVDSSGTVQWLRYGYSTGVTIATAIDVDDNGDIYITGFTTQSATFTSAPATGITSAGVRDVFLVKYNSAGTKQWVVNAVKGTQTKNINGMSVSAPSGTGNLIITGSFDYTASFGGTIPLTANGGLANSQDIFVASYNTYNGAVNWAIQGGSSLDNEIGYDVAATPSWNSYIVGVFEGTATFGGTNVATGTGGSDIYISTVALNYLPVSFLDFAAKPNDSGDKVDLSWITSSETNNHYFSVERSGDGENFVTILTKNGAGNSSQIMYYTDVDESPLPGTSYYRLKQTDYDGKQSYSKMISVFIDDRKNFSVTLYPNPATMHNEINLKFSELPVGDVTLMVFNQLGQVIFNEKVNTSIITNNEILLSGLLNISPGNYSVTIMNYGYTSTKKLIIL